MLCRAHVAPRDTPICAHTVTQNEHDHKLRGITGNGDAKQINSLIVLIFSYNQQTRLRLSLARESCPQIVKIVRQISFCHYSHFDIACSYIGRNIQP